MAERRAQGASSRTAAARGTVTSGEASSTTGSNVIAPICQSETISTCARTAASAGSSSGARNATSTSRRAGSAGQSVSASARKLGRAVAHARTTGAAMYPATPARNPSADMIALSRVA